MQEVKTVDLAGPALDWAIAQIEGVEVAIAAPQYGTGWRVYKPNFGGKYSPSTDWAVGGPLIQKHRITIEGPGHSAGKWRAFMLGSSWIISTSSDAPLEAACRRLVHEQLGDTVKVPKELVP